MHFTCSAEDLRFEIQALSHGEWVDRTYGNRPLRKPRPFGEGYGVKFVCTLRPSSAGEIYEQYRIRSTVPSRPPSDWVTIAAPALETNYAPIWQVSESDEPVNEVLDEHGRCVKVVFLRKPVDDGQDESHAFAMRWDLSVEESSEPSTKRSQRVLHFTNNGDIDRVAAQALPVESHIVPDFGAAVLVLKSGCDRRILLRLNTNRPLAMPNGCSGGFRLGRAVPVRKLARFPSKQVELLHSSLDESVNVLPVRDVSRGESPTELVFTIDWLHDDELTLSHPAGVVAFGVQGWISFEGYQGFVELNMLVLAAFSTFDGSDRSPADRQPSPIGSNAKGFPRGVVACQSMLKRQLFSGEMVLTVPPLSPGAEVQVSILDCSSTLAKSVVISHSSERLTRLEVADFSGDSLQVSALRLFSASASTCILCCALHSV
jgi:hypothetical protein